MVWTETWTFCGKHCVSLVDGIMDAEVSAQIGAQHGERSPERGHLPQWVSHRTWDTRVGTMELHIPKLREGSYFPSLLEPRRRSEKALLAVIQQAYVEGVSTRRVDDLIKALGCDGISSSQVSRICVQLDEVVESFLGRPLDGGPLPLRLAGRPDAEGSGGWSHRQRLRGGGDGGHAEGQREILGLDVGASEDGAFWLAFLRSLTARGLSGVELVTSDAHQGLKNAIAAVFTGPAGSAAAPTSWPTCSPECPSVPNLACHPDILAWSAPSTSNCLPPSPRPIGPSGGTTPGSPLPRWPSCWRMPRRTSLACTAFQWPTGRSCGPTTRRKRLNGEIRRRLTWWAFSPNRLSARRLVGAVLAEQHDEWAEARRYLTIPNAAGNEALPEPNMLDAAA